MKSLIGLWREVSRDLETWHGVSTDRDYKTVTRRVESEGLSFLTITLPQFASDFERSLDRGWVGSDLFCGFHFTGGLPAFLSGFLRRIFDATTGVILDEPCVDSVIAIRQLCYLFKKLNIDCAPRRTARAIQGFVSCEMEMRSQFSEWTPERLREFSRLSSLLFGDVFDRVNREVDTFEIFPKHGPGATADHLNGNQKWTFPTWTDRLEMVFPYVEYGIPNHRYWDDDVIHLNPSEEQPVRVVTVPKTQKSPRVIAIEPTCMQYMQQGIKDSLVSKLESMTPSRYFVGFSDQTPNQRMAREGSLTGSLATLDLSEASDRVANQLVIEMLRPWPSLLEAVQATRSRSAVLGNGTKVRLAKFASMGSALCFPVEAMVFTTLTFMGIQDATSRRLVPRDFVKFRGKVRVYGDDIIVPVDCAIAVSSALEAFGLKVNATKSFWTGRFRESCGADYFQGEWVTPLRLGSMPPRSRQDASEAQTWVEFSNALHLAGYWRAAIYCTDELRPIFGQMPVTSGSSNALTLRSFLGDKPSGTRWSVDFHKPLVKAWVVENRSPRNEISGIPALHKTLVGDWSDPLFHDHLERSGRSSSAHVKRRWVPC